MRVRSPTRQGCCENGDCIHGTWHTVFHHDVESLPFFPASIPHWVTVRKHNKLGTATFMPKMEMHVEMHVLGQRKPGRSWHALLTFWVSTAFSFNSSHLAEVGPDGRWTVQCQDLAHQEKSPSPALRPKFQEKPRQTLVSRACLVRIIASMYLQD